MLVAAGGAAAVALGGCLGDAAVAGNDSAGNSEGTGAIAVDGSGELGDPAETVEVRLQSYPTPAVDPNLVHVVPGGTVEWVGDGLRNTTTAYHSETNGPQRIPDSAEPWDSGLLRKDSRFTHTFEETGAAGTTSAEVRETDHATYTGQNTIYVQ